MAYLQHVSYKWIFFFTTQGWMIIESTEIKIFSQPGLQKQKTGLAEAISRPNLTSPYRQNIYPMKLKFIFSSLEYQGEAT